MNYLGLDYGRKHIGVAIATGPLAEPLTTIFTPRAFPQIKNLITKHNVSQIIIGRPDKSLKLEFENFLNSLQIPNFQFQIVDETLSSHSARLSLLHKTKKSRRVREHAAAAAIILQSWLDSHLSCL